MESKRRRFHPFRGLRRMFRRKGRHSGSELAETPEKLSTEETVAALDSHRSRSTSELLAGDEPNRRRRAPLKSIADTLYWATYLRSVPYSAAKSGGDAWNTRYHLVDECCYWLSSRRSGTGLFPGHSGLSVSHDSVFTAEQRSSHSSCEDLDIGQSSSSLSIQQLVLPGVRLGNTRGMSDSHTGLLTHLQQSEHPTFSTSRDLPRYRCLYTRASHSGRVVSRVGITGSVMSKSYPHIYTYKIDMITTGWDLNSDFFGTGKYNETDANISFPAGVGDEKGSLKENSPAFSRKESGKTRVVNHIWKNHLSTSDLDSNLYFSITGNQLDRETGASDHVATGCGLEHTLYRRDCFGCVSCSSSPDRPTESRGKDKGRVLLLPLRWYGKDKKMIYIKSVEVGAHADETIILKQLPVKHRKKTAWLVAFVSMVTKTSRRLHRSSPRLLGQIYTWSRDCQCRYQRHEPTRRRISRLFGYSLGFDSPTGANTYGLFLKGRYQHVRNQPAPSMVALDDKLFKYRENVVIKFQDVIDRYSRTKDTTVEEN
uniref:Uncharacterized protein n=1 Tax=Timema douglasi TaxID=61478 RepID=A0A7R8VFU8_TIMDO|nr:unnamed protein product [Timema douglasi]